MARTWTSSDPRWQALNPYQRAAAMSLMEADKMDPEAAKNALAAMVNRSKKEGVDLGQHVSGAIYQPTIEPAQQSRLDRILKSPAFTELTGWAERRANGQEPDPVNGATHFLAPESTMLALERQNPSKYRNWGPRGANWTGYDPTTGQYKGVVMRDASHAFLAPDGAYSAPSEVSPTNVAQNAPAPSPQPTSTEPGGHDMNISSMVSQLFGGASGQSPGVSSTPGTAANGGWSTQTAAASSPWADIMKSLYPEDDKQQTQQPTAVASAQPLPALPQQMQRPVDMTRLRQVLASRARLGTGVA